MSSGNQGVSRFTRLAGAILFVSLEFASSAAGVEVSLVAIQLLGANNVYWKADGETRPADFILADADFLATALQGCVLRQHVGNLR